MKAMAAVIFQIWLIGVLFTGCSNDHYSGLQIAAWPITAWKETGK